MQMNVIRELSLEERALVSDGAHGNTVEFPGVEVRPEADYPSDQEPYWDRGEDYRTESTPYDWVDAQADNFARQLVEKIKADPAYNSREIGAIIYKDSVTGEMKVSPLGYASSGNPGAISYPIDQWGISPSEIIGIVHSHPTGVFDEKLHWLNIYPSDDRIINGDNYEGGDWRMADILRDHGMNADTFRYYIIGPDNITREYDFTDRDAETPGIPLTPESKP